MANRGLEVILAVVVGVVLAVSAVVVFGLGGSGTGADTGDAAQSPQQSVNVPAVQDTLPTSPRATTEKVLAVWERAYNATYALDGSLEIHAIEEGESPNMGALDSEPSVVIDVRRANLDGRELDQVDDSALSIGPSGQRTCERSDDVFLCTEPSLAPTNERRLELIASRIDGDAAEYHVWPDDSCWLAVAIEPTTNGAWGQVTRWCFDDATGVLIERTTWRGARLERFVATDLRSDVTEADLAPK